MVKIDATFRMVRFEPASRFVAIAWNYPAAVLIATRDHPSYGDARAELQTICDERAVFLRWFDGEYECLDGETILPALRRV